MKVLNVRLKLVSRLYISAIGIPFHEYTFPFWVIKNFITILDDTKFEINGD